ncbi:Zinc finger CCCH domain-containing protein 49 [Nymphaea thermarum]|nr:Zinc finger CCCH domain-containing protein 49 [Nymphaea thermarum]
MPSVSCSLDQLQFLSGKKARPSLAGFADALDLSPRDGGTATADSLRRLLLQRADSIHSDCSLSPPEAYALRRFLPSNCEDDESVPDDYACDDFRMYEFKVRRCTRARSHDWTDCPFAHPGEKARRRDPRRFNYSGTVCPDFRKGACRKGDACEFAHGVFECWLHPERYRTQPCKDGRSCRRKVCFFAHTPQQLRVLTQPSNAQSPSRSPHCCVLCSTTAAASAARTAHPKLHQLVPQGGGSSPDSPLLIGVSHFSPPASPPVSPPVSPVSPFFPSYQSMMCDLSNSFESMDLNPINLLGNTNSTTILNAIPRSFAWSQLASVGDRSRAPHSCSSPTALWKLQEEEEEMQREMRMTNRNSIRSMDDQNSGIAMSDPDIAWVNELLM